MSRYAPQGSQARVNSRVFCSGARWAPRWPVLIIFRPARTLKQPATGTLTSGRPGVVQGQSVSGPQGAR